MPGGGLFALVSYGTQNVILNSNPDITFFYKTFRKYSHFSEESVTIAMNGPNEVAATTPVQVRLKLQRIAELVRDLYFVFRIPDIYSKYVVRDALYICVIPPCNATDPVFNGASCDAIYDLILCDNTSSPL